MIERTLLVRVDGGRRVGLGHLMRCLYLARALDGQGVATVLVVRERPELRALLAPERITTVDLEPEADEITAAAMVREVRGSLGADAVLIDLPDDLEPEEYDVYADIGAPLILMDDHGPAGEGAELVINAIAHPDHLRDQVRENSYHSGPEFLILDPAYLEAEPATTRDQAAKILIAMGGSDPHGITAKALRALVSLQDEIELHVLLGPAFAGEEKLTGIAGGAGRPVFISGSTDHLPRYLAGFDLAVLSFGLTAYGAAHLGVPAVLLAHDQPGAEAGSAFERLLGCARFLGRHDQVSELEILNAVQMLIKDSKERLGMARRGREAVDGRGLERVKRLALELLF